MGYAEYGNEPFPYNNMVKPNNAYMSQIRNVCN